MELSLFDYKIKEELIAQKPTGVRGESRMLVYDRVKNSISHKKFVDIILFLQAGDVLVFNDSKVIPARLRGKKKTGAKVEVLLINEVSSNVWKCLVKPGSKFKKDTEIFFSNDIVGFIKDILPDGERLIDFKDVDIREHLDEIGEMPLPPYIRRGSKDEEDLKRYQTVYAANSGAIASPTAGLHFTDEIFARIREKGVEVVFVTLHVGIGTFKPVEVEDIELHKMHTEEYVVSEDAANKINFAKKEGRRIIVVGTTSARVLESIVDDKGNVKAGKGKTNIFIYPPYNFKIVNHMITNFHLPKSTLLMLVSAFAGRENILRAYKEAMKDNYRFFSYGDCMFII